MTIAGAATGTIWMLKIRAGEQPWPKKKKIKKYIHIYIYKTPSQRKLH